MKAKYPQLKVERLSDCCDWPLVGRDIPKRCLKCGNAAGSYEVTLWDAWQAVNRLARDMSVVEQVCRQMGLNFVADDITTLRHQLQVEYDINVTEKD